MNNKEIELKYLIDKLPPINYLNKLNIIQSYIDNSKCLPLLKSEFPESDLSNIHTFRIRSITEKDITKYYLTLKSSSNSYERLELEKEISKELYNILYHYRISTINKNRYLYSLDNHILEVDEYLNLKSIMYTLEIEFDSLESLSQSKEIIESKLRELSLDIKDVSLDMRYRNSNLIKYFG